MAHRGRLSVLHCILDKPAETIFAGFLDSKTNQNKAIDPLAEDEQPSGDVKYHVGVTAEK
jgi:2-oxoglutarate dehydrogenase complex dehydrogenase (E1) component-like enzyme